MYYYLIKLLISASLIVAISEIAKRSSAFAALVAALPLTSLLAIIWLHLEASPNQHIATLSSQIFWLVLPSLLLFIVLPILLKMGWGFWASLSVAIVATIAAYLLLIPVLRRFGVDV